MYKETLKCWHQQSCVFLCRRRHNHIYTSTVFLLFLITATTCTITQSDAAITNFYRFKKNGHRVQFRTFWHSYKSSITAYMLYRFTIYCTGVAVIVSSPFILHTLICIHHRPCALFVRLTWFSMQVKLWGKLWSLKAAAPCTHTHTLFLQVRKGWGG